MSQSLTNNPPLLVNHEELLELDRILDGCSHGFAKQMIQWVNWVRGLREQELRQHQEKANGLKTTHEGDSNLKAVEAEVNDDKPVKD